ncbi:dynein heavy chain domain-containing protein [Suillus placidus]|uniref:Dynein heavy chain domain-containing protein n=1 Tax=Suillus placidus TaxID=48579 RepID=A0A9P7CXV8_9AGAM|nr:dynein heavy chain domain-containing protein [Suillus placidus]
MVANEVPAATPLALVLVTGYDASYRVENLIQSTGGCSSSVAMGSQEGFTLADQAITAASHQGTWVLLKNVHLAPMWLGQLEKKLQMLNPHQNFRLFLTLEVNPSIPVNILCQSLIIMNEPLPGIKANLLDSLGSIMPQWLAQGPSEKICWSKTYDFNNSDMASAFRTINTWLNAVAKGRANIDPANIPWDALRTLIKQSVYGGRVDSDFDQHILDAFVNKLFTPAAYNVDFNLVPTISGSHALEAPDGTKLEHFLSWVQRLPDREPPAWLSLPPTAERVIAVVQGNELLGKLRKMRTLADDDELGSAAGPSKSQTSQQPAWMRNLHKRCREWLMQLPLTLNTLSKQSNDNPDPLYCLFFREASIRCKLLDQVHKDLADVVKVCNGELKQTNHLQTLMSSLTKGTIPSHWRRYKVPKVMSMSEWIPDLARRLSQLDGITSMQQNLSNVEVWLGGLFFPKAYITATRQAVAHRKWWSLETLHLCLDIGQMNDPAAFIVDGLVLEGAAWDTGNEKLVLNDGQAVQLNASQICWVQDDSSNKEQPANLVTLPVYLNNDRSDVMFTVDLLFDGHLVLLVAMRGQGCLSDRKGLSI